MREQLEQRLQQLKAEFETGQKMLPELEQRRVSLEQTLLRITGAIQVLEELLATSTIAVDGVEPTVGSTHVAAE